jgi:WD40 repeat protein
MRRRLIILVVTCWGGSVSIVEGSLRVFLSHTSELRKYPQERSFVAAAERAVIRAGATVLDMEYFPAREGKPAEYCRQQVRQAQVYVGIIGFLYGSTVRDEPERSYTELEFDTASELGLPRLIFLLDEEAVLPLPQSYLSDPEYAKRQRAFRKRISDADMTVRRVESPADMELLLFQALIDLGVQVAESTPPDRSAYSRQVSLAGIEAHISPVAGRQWSSGPHVVPSLPTHYVKRSAFLEELAALVVDPATAGRSVTLVGMGGVGKTVLAAALTKLPEVRRRFPDGLAWVSVSRRGLPQAQAELAIQLDGQALGADLEANRLQLARLLDGRACLVVLDDVWDMEALDAFDCLSSSGRLLVTTRDVDIARQGGSYLEITQLAFGQSLELLARWINIKQSQLPPRADELCMEVNHLALGVATVGALVAAGGGGAQWDTAWADVLTRLQAADLDKVGHKFSNYEHRTLLRAIDVSLDTLDDEQRRRYHELAVFSGVAEVPRSAVEALWMPKGCTSTDTGELLRLLASRSLLRVSDGQHIGLHDLQYDVATYYMRQRPEGLPRGHEQLLDGYRQRLSAHWHAPTDASTVFVALAGEMLRRSSSDPLRRAAADGYLFDHLAFHLARAGQGESLHTLLVTYDWLQLGVTDRDFAALLADFLHAAPSDDAVAQVHGSLQLASQVLALTPAALPAQLLGRLLGNAETALQPLLTLAAGVRSGPWLRPRRASLTPPGGPLQFLLTGHSAAVVAVAISADGSRAITGSIDSTARVWDLASGRCEHVLADQTDQVGAVAISADGTRAITGSDSTDPTARVWNLASGRCEHVLTGHLGYVGAVAISPDGTRAITGSGDWTARVWDLASGRCEHVLAGHTDQVGAVAISADGTRAITGSDSRDHTARVWDLASGRCDHVLTGHLDQVGAVAISADGTRAITGSIDSTARVWDLESGRCEHRLTGHDDLVGAVAISADGTRAITGSRDRTARVWDLESGRCDHVLTGHTFRVAAVAISADGTRAITGSGSRDLIGRIWDMESHRRTNLRTGHIDRVRAATSAYGARAVTGPGFIDHTARVWDLASGRCEHVLTGHADLVGAVAISADGTSAVTGSGDRGGRVWDLASEPRVHKLTSHTAAVRAVAVSADGTRAISGSLDGAARVWDLASGRCEHVLTGHTDLVGAVAISADGTRAITGSIDSTARVWDLESGRCEHRLTGHNDLAGAVAISADGTRAITGSGDGTVRVWDLASGRCEHKLTGHYGYVKAVAVSADRTRAVTGSADWTARVWDLASGRCEHELPGHYGYVKAVAVSADGNRAVTSSGDGTVRVWDLASGRCEHELTGHTDLVGAVAISADGTRAVTGSADWTARVWDLASGCCEHVLTGHTDLVGAVAISADGTRTITGGSHDHTVRLWDLLSGQQIDQWHGEQQITSIGASLDLLHIAAGDRSGQVHILDLGADLVGAETAAPDSETAAPDWEQVSAQPGSPDIKRHWPAGILSRRRRST